MIMNIVKEIVNDTLKKKTEDGKMRWSRTSLTMFTSYLFATTTATIYFIMKGFNFEVFLVFMGTAVSTKISDAIGNRISTK
jgi:hypothetical protein